MNAAGGPRLLGSTVVFVLAATTGGCFPLVTPPLKGDLGYATRLGGDSGYRASGGVSVASVVPDPNFPIDLGGGYVITDTTTKGKDRPVSGAYLESGARIRGGKFWRVFAGPRFEYYFQPKGPEPGFAGMARLEIEVFGSSYLEPFQTEGSKTYWGVALGSGGIGAYLEAGYQHLPNEAAFPLLGGGVQLRIPLTAGFVCCAWDLAKSTTSK